MKLSKYIGLSFQENGRGPRYYDCWGLYQTLVRDFSGVELPDYLGVDACDVGSVASTMESVSSGVDWMEVDPEDEDFLDCVLMKEPVRVEGRTEVGLAHVGCALGDGSMIHIRRGMNSVLSQWRDTPLKSADKLVTRRVSGLFRPRSLVCVQ